MIARKPAPAATATSTVGPRGWRWLDHRAAYALAVPVLTFVNSGLNLLVPLLLSPAGFGEYALLVSIFQIGAFLDFGLSPLTDRLLTRPQEREAHDHTVAEMLNARCAVALAALCAALPPLFLFVRTAPDQPSALQIAIALGGGACLMLANGPVCVFRATSRVRQYAAAALLLQAGGAVRIVGLVAGGITGCFLVLTAWTGAMAATLNWSMGTGVRRLALRPLLKVLGAGFPLFALNLLWLLYITANRWLSWALTDHYQFGLFAFGANFNFMLVGYFTTLASVYYPQRLAQINRMESYACSPSLAAELLRLSLALSAGLAALILALGPSVRLILPHFAAAVAPASILLAACLPLSVVAWTFPITTALARRPFAVAAAVYLLPLIALSAGMVIGDRAASIVGQSWACLAAALVLLCTELTVLAGQRVLRPAAALGLVLLVAAAASLLGMLAWWCYGT